MLGATASQEVNARYLPKLTALMIVQHTNEAVCLAKLVKPISQHLRVGHEPFSLAAVVLDPLHIPLTSVRSLSPLASTMGPGSADPCQMVDCPARHGSIPSYGGQTEAPYPVDFVRLACSSQNVSGRASNAAFRDGVHDKSYDNGLDA
jgi:hypothetical protein